MTATEHPLARHLPKGYPRTVAELANWELDALACVAERPCRSEKRAPIDFEGDSWAVAQTVTTMEHIALRDIEKTNHGAFVPTYAKHWKVDGRQYSKEYPLLNGYVFFLTKPDDWAGIPDIHGVYRVLSTADWTPCRVTEKEMARLVMSSALNRHTEIAPHRYTKYYRPSDKPKRKSSRRPRPGKRIRTAIREARNHTAP